MFRLIAASAPLMLPHDLAETLRVTKVQDHQRPAIARVVPVALDETGHHHMAAKVDDPSFCLAPLASKSVCRYTATGNGKNS